MKRIDWEINYREIECAIDFYKENGCKSIAESKHLDDLYKQKNELSKIYHLTK